MGFEPTTASLEGWNSTTELRPPTRNQLPSPYLRRAATGSRNITALLLRTAYFPIGTLVPSHIVFITYGSAWCGGQARVRTLEAIRQQIYSLPPLSTWVPARTPYFRLSKNNTNSIRFFS